MTVNGKNKPFGAHKKPNLKWEVGLLDVDEILATVWVQIYQLFFYKTQLYTITLTIKTHKKEKLIW